MKDFKQIYARSSVGDAVCKVDVNRNAENGNLAKSLNTLRTVPGHPNPFVTSQRSVDQPATDTASSSSHSEKRPASR